MSPYEAVQVFEHLRDTGVIEEAGELFGRSACKGLFAEAEAREKLDKAAPALADALVAAGRAFHLAHPDLGVPFELCRVVVCEAGVAALKLAGRLP
jgi:hypothetical protein